MWVSVSNLKGDEGAFSESDTHASYPLWHITSMLLWVPEYNTRWKEVDGEFFLFSDDFNSDQYEMFTPEPLFYRCPERWEWHYVLTPYGEEVVQKLEEAKNRHQKIAEDTKKATSNIVPFPLLPFENKKEAA